MRAAGRGGTGQAAAERRAGGLLTLPMRTARRTPRVPPRTIPARVFVIICQLDGVHCCIALLTASQQQKGPAVNWGAANSFKRDLEVSTLSPSSTVNKSD